MKRPDSSLHLPESEQFLDFDFQNLCELFQASDGRGVNATLHQADKLNRAGEGFRQLLLSKLSAFAEAGNSPAEFLLEHAV